MSREGTLFLKDDEELDDGLEHENSHKTAAIVFVCLGVLLIIGCVFCCNYFRKQMDDDYVRQKAVARTKLAKEAVQVI